ncbi:MAG: penicillin-binding protein 1A [Pseudomonadota bacterium]
MSKFRRFIKYAAIAVVISALLGFAGLAGLYWYLEPKLPEVEALRDFELQEPLRVYSQDGKLIAEYGTKRRMPLDIDDTPELLKQAFIAAEDDRFYEHPGVDWQGIVRAAVMWGLTGERAQGGSTITMQVARNFFLSREKTILRKLNEMLLALKISRELSKEKVLELYFNKIYLGKRAYGVAAAAKTYYGKEVGELSVAEMAVIAGLPKAPSSNNPIDNPERALSRRNYVLGRMLALGYIDETVHQQAVEAPVTAKMHAVNPEVEAYYVGEMVRHFVAETFPDAVYEAGMSVYTTVDSEMQQAASRALRAGLRSVDQRHGYRGPLAQLEDWRLEDGEVDSEAFEDAVSDLPSAGGLEPALVTSVDEESASLYLGEETVAEFDLEAVSWARHIRDNGRVGPEIEAVDEVLAEGDLVWVEFTSEGRVRLAQSPEVEGALVALDPEDGALRALVGGYDFFRSKFNRAAQAERQTGSSFKPFLYAAALDQGYTAATVINDAPVVFDDPALESKWKPENYSGKFYGPTRLREGLVRSRNLVSIRLLIQLGIQPVRRFAMRLGFDPEHLSKDLSLALGSNSATPLEMASHFSVFANNGFRVAPYFIDRIEDRNSRVVYASPRSSACGACFEDEDEAVTTEEEQPSMAGIEGGDEVVDEASAAALEAALEGEEHESEVEPEITPAERVLDPAVAFITRSMMQDVVKRGTARKALRLGRNDLAGKTGTTNDLVDAWFSGFNDDLVASVWVGHDSLKTLGFGGTGAGAALPIWVDFMEVALRDSESSRLVQPEGVVSIRIDPESGLLAYPGQSNAIFEYFREENVPTETAVPDSANFYNSDDSREEDEEGGEEESAAEPLF